MHHDVLAAIIADLRTEVRRLARRGDRLEAGTPQAGRAGEEQVERPPGEWVGLKVAAHEFGVSLGWLYDHRHSDEIPE
jgi:hypothetical protein